MDRWDERQLDWIWRNRRRSSATKRLGFSVEGFVKRWAGPARKRLSVVGSAWRALLPAELVQHTCLDGLNRGQLRVLVDSGAHMSELHFLVRQGDLLEQLRDLCPNISLSRIRLVRGNWSKENEEGVNIIDFT
ncbi:MAG: DUF721 domain-containing protein [Sedimentisphaerales bacterium]|nr:DUF721 domain-containing protein [Sedimentisphaerales bacterium]